jgi:hypothetical protein
MCIVVSRPALSKEYVKLAMCVLFLKQEMHQRMFSLPLSLPPSFARHIKASLFSCSSSSIHTFPQLPKNKTQTTDIDVLSGSPKAHH